MKLRYYMRGLGIGILVAGIILSVSHIRANGISDEEIKRRAADLGMVMEDKSVLSDTSAESEAETASETAELETAETVVETEPESAELETVEPESVEPVEVETANGTDIGAIAEAEGSEKTPIENITTEDTSAQVSDPAGNQSQAETVTLEVRGGDSSVSVAKKAAAAGLVTSASEFDKFLCAGGYDKKICVGSYEVPSGATEEEIAKIITKR